MIVITMMGMTTLHPDLLSYYEEGPSFPMIRHPLVFAVPYFPGMEDMLNRSLEIKSEAVRDAIAAGAISKAVFLHERPYRFDAFFALEQSLDDDKFWELLSSVWTDSENIRENQESWAELWTSERLFRNKAMDDADAALLDSLPQEVTVYRGFINDTAAASGISWTTDRNKAEWFAKRFQGKPYIATATVDKSVILAAFVGRGESEVVIVDIGHYTITEL